MHATNPAAWLGELLDSHAPPCVSIYMPFARTKPLSQQNRILMNSLVDRACSAMDRRYDGRAIRIIRQKLEDLGDSDALRSGSHDGLAVFAAVDCLRIVELPRPVISAVEVGDSFYIKPLVRVMQQGARFAILCLSVNNVRVLEGDQYHLREVAVKNVPRNVGQALKDLGIDLPAESNIPHTRRHHPPPADEDNLGVGPFLRAVDQGIWENYSRDSRLPLVVCADPKRLAQFLSISKNPCVLGEGLAYSPDHLSIERLRDEAWKIIEPRYRQELEHLKDQFHVAKAHQKGSDELMQVAEAAALGRVGTLLIDEQATIPGVLHRASGLIESPAGRNDPKATDILDDLAEIVLLKDGQVFVIPHDSMPTDAGLAAMYRY